MIKSKLFNYTDEGYTYANKHTNKQHNDRMHTTSLGIMEGVMQHLVISLYIGECSSTLYVGLMGIVRNLIQKSTGMDMPLLIKHFSPFHRDVQGYN